MPTRTVHRRDLRGRQQTHRYQLTPVEALPSRARRQGIYASIVEDFIVDDEGQERVDITPAVRPLTLAQGLRKAIKAIGAAHVKVTQRGEDVYLVQM